MLLSEAFVYIDSAGTLPQHSEKYLNTSIYLLMHIQLHGSLIL